MTLNPEHNKQWSADSTWKIPNKPEKMKRAELVHTILQLRRAGWTEKQISVVVRKRVREVRKIIWLSLKKVGRQLCAHADELFAQEYERLEEIWRAIWPKVVAGDLRAIEQAARISERRAKMCGLDAPVKQEVTIDAQLQTLSQQELLAHAEALGLNLPTEAPLNLPSFLPGEAPQEAEYEVLPAPVAIPPGEAPAPEPPTGEALPS